MVGRSTLADHYRSQAEETVASDPARALQQVGDSLDLNADAVTAWYAKSAAYARLGRYQSARAALLEAARREPHNYVPWALLGDPAVRHGEFREARREYRRALRLNPREGSLARLAENPSARPGD